MVNTISYTLCTKLQCTERDILQNCAVPLGEGRVEAFALPTHSPEGQKQRFKFEPMLTLYYTRSIPLTDNFVEQLEAGNNSTPASVCKRILQPFKDSILKNQETGGSPHCEVKSMVTKTG